MVDLAPGMASQDEDELFPRDPSGSPSVTSPRSCSEIRELAVQQATTTARTASSVGLQRELARLQAEYRELEVATAEQDASSSVALQDARLQKLRLEGVVARYRARAPTTEELADLHEKEIADLIEEVCNLREEGAALAGFCGERPQTADAEGKCVAVPRPAAKELCDDVRRMWRRQTKWRQQERRTEFEERQLERVRLEAQGIVKELKMSEQRVAQLRSQHARAVSRYQEATGQRSLHEADLGREKETSRVLHGQVVTLREACYLPARIKRESSFLIRMLDHEGGRVQTKRHLQGLQLSKRLYGEVAVRAPALLATIGRAHSEMQAEFDRYLRLEQAHGLALQKVHLAVTRGLLSDTDVLAL